MSYTRILSPAKGSFFLFGPRGTGKSTWLRAQYPEAVTLDLLDERRYQAYLADPGLFGAELRVVPPSRRVVVDEIQRLPALLNEVQRAMELRRQRFVLCGSSARKLKQSGTNLLAGRAVWRAMHPLVPEELGSDFSLERILSAGSLPVAWDSDDAVEALDAYTRMYLREEIQAEALVRNLPGFARFLPVAALFHGQTLNAASLARDAGVARATVLGYLDILEDTLIAFRLPAFEGRLRVRERRHPKLYWVDPGLVRANKRQLGPLSAEERGPLFEGWVAELLAAYRDYRGLFDDWSYWASSHTEVDFLLRRGEAFVAIEVKAARRLDKATYAGLRAIAPLTGLCRRLVVYGGSHHTATEDGIEVLPVADFLAELESGTLFTPR